eukprot:scaffold85657_cov66-Phaeocystis_antarctica.AAC.3
MARCMSGTHPHAPQLRREVQADHEAGVKCPPVAGLSFVDEDEEPHGRSECWDAGAYALEGLRVHKVGVASLTLRREVGEQAAVKLTIGRLTGGAISVISGRAATTTNRTPSRHLTTAAESRSHMVAVSSTCWPPAPPRMLPHGSPAKSRAHIRVPPRSPRPSPSAVSK